MGMATFTSTSVDRASGRLRGGWLGRWSESAEVEVEVAMPMGRCLSDFCARRVRYYRALHTVIRE